MQEAIPILVGLSGKRDLGPHAAAAGATLDAVLAALECAFPHAPKVLVSGLAAGADILGTRLALDRGWRAIALLPFDRTCYRATLPAEAQETFDTLLAHPGVQVRTLSPLRPDAPACGTTHGPEYEQLGLFLADNTPVMIALMPADEKPGRLGGTGRVVAHRCRREPDVQAQDVIGRSQDLPPRLPLQLPERGTVCVIHTDATPDAAGLLAATLRDDESTTSDNAARLPAGKRAMAAALRRAFPAAANLDAYNRRAGASLTATWPAPPQPVQETVRKLRGSISAVQRRHQTAWRRMVWTLTGLFVLAVALLEGFAKFHGWPFAERLLLSHWGGAGYATLVLAGVAVHQIGRRRRWQLVHQDYRAVNEVLRVQMAWWAAGISSPADRADRHYLVGAVGALRRVRDAASAAIVWIRLAAAPAKPDDAAVDGEKGWVPEQVSYFARRTRERETEMRRVALVSWGGFCLALGLAVWLGAYAVGEDTWPGSLAREVTLLPAAAVQIALAMVPWLVTWEEVAGPETAPGLSLFAGICVLVGTAALPAALCPLAAYAAPGLPEAPKTLAVVAVVLLLAVAGAVRFVAEKLVWEAEAHAYAEALARFDEARRRLRLIDTMPEPSRTQARRALVRALGLAALAESESWLRAHRERPAEPVVGA